MHQIITAPPMSGRLAVIPFVNAGGRPESEYLSNGVSEDLINRLAQMSELKVIARGSSFKFKQTESTSGKRVENWALKCS
jgi:TolB-like protein